MHLPLIDFLIKDVPMAFAMWKVKRHLLKQRMRKLVNQRTCGGRVSRCGCGMQHGSQLKTKENQAWCKEQIQVPRAKILAYERGNTKEREYHQAQVLAF